MEPLLNESEEALRARASATAVDIEVEAAAAALQTELRIPTELLAKLTSEGFLPLRTPIGDGEVAPLLALALVTEELSRASAAVGLVVAYAGVGELATRDAGLPDRPSEPEPGALCVPLGLDTIALTASESDGWRIDGQIELVPAAIYATRFLAAARTHIADGSAEFDTGVFLVEVSQAGVDVSEPANLMGWNGGGTADVRLGSAAATRLDGDTDSDAAGAILDMLRVAQAAHAVGIGAGAMAIAIDDVTRRRDAGDRVDRSQAVQWALADCATELEAARLSTWHAAWEGDNNEANGNRGINCVNHTGRYSAGGAAMARLLSAGAAVRASRRALQVVGPGATRRGHPLERTYRDAKLLELHSGTNEQQLSHLAAQLLPELD